MIEQDQLTRIRTIRERYERHIKTCLSYRCPQAVAESLAAERIGAEAMDAVDALLAERDELIEMTHLANRTTK